MKNKNNTPLDGIAGLKQNVSTDAISGFLVFLLALPLSLGIAKASDFPPIMGLITAMVGGIVVSLISGSRLTIKGPAAGLIVIVAGSVAEFGKGDSTLGWHLALGAVAIAGILQIFFGVFKLGKLVDFFPLSAVHGMLAAIGLIILSKQIHILLGINPTTEAGKPMVEPLELISEIPHTLGNFDKNAAIVGIVSLLIVFLWPRVKNAALKKIPAPVLVLLVAIPLAQVIGLDKSKLIHFDKGLFDSLAINISFAGMNEMGTFIKYVIMFALVGSLESLLTVKAIDMLDPYKRKSNANKDLIAVGIGNTISAILGGLPMISEVARSSSNVNNGAKTRWANFFHGVFVFLFLVFTLQFSDLIPSAALAAMLIGVGYKLASPKEFSHMFKVGPEQLLIFVATIIATLATDLLVGIAVGIIVKLIVQNRFGVAPSSMFKSQTVQSENKMVVHQAAVFSNWLGIQKKLQTIPHTSNYTIDFSNCSVVDHTVMENLYHLQMEFEHEGGKLHIHGIEEMEHSSKEKHHLSARVRKNKKKGA